MEFISLRLIGKNALILVVFLACMLASFSQYYLSDRVPFYYYDHNQDMGWSAEGVQNLRSHNNAQWFPNYNLGMSKSGGDPAFNSNNLDNILMSFFPFDTMAMYIFFLQLKMALMGFCAYALIRYFGYSIPLSLMGGVLFMFNPFIHLHYYGFYPYLFIFTPLYVLMVHEWKKGENRGLIFFLWGLAAGIQYCGGGMITLYYTYIGIALYALITAITQRWRLVEAASFSAFIIPTGLIALAIGAYMFVPGLDLYFHQEHRIKPLGGATSFFYFSHFSFFSFIQELLGFIFPMHISISFPNPDWGGFGRIERDIGVIRNCLSLLTIPAILLVASNWKTAGARLKGLVVFLVVYYFLVLNPIAINPDCIQKIFPFYTLAFDVAIFHLCSAIMIIAVIDGLRNGTLKMNGWIGKFTAAFSAFYFLLAILYLLFIAFFNTYDQAALLNGFLDKFGHGQITKLGNVVLIRLFAEYYFHSFAAVLLTVLLLARGAQLWLFSRFNGKYFLLGMFALLIIDYACFSRLVDPFVDENTLEFNAGKTAENRFIQSLPAGTRVAYQWTSPNPNFSAKPSEFEMDRRLMNLPMDDLKKEVKEKYPFDYLLGYVYPFRHDAAIFGVYNVTVSDKVDKYIARASAGNPLYDEIKGSWPYIHTFWLFTNENSPLVKPLYSYLIRRNEYHNMYPVSWPLLLKGEYYSIYKNVTALPRIYFAENTLFEANTDKALDMLEAPGFDWEHTVIVHDAANTMQRTDSNAKTGAYNIIGQRIIYNDVNIDIHNESPGILVINDLYYAYWSAKVNGKAAEVFPVNTIFRAVKLEAENNHVEMRFENPMVKTGIWITISALALCLGGILYFGFVRKQAVKARE